MKKVLSFIAITALLMAFMLPLGAAAFAEETTETVATATETTVILDEQTALDNFFSRYIIPIVGGTAASAITIGLAVALPLIKKSNAYKLLSAGYRTVKEKAEKAEAKLLKVEEELKSYDINKILGQVTTAVTSTAMDKIGQIVKQEMDKRADQTAKLLVNSELSMGLLSNFLSAANIVWGQNVDGVSALLAKAPTITLLEEKEEKIAQLQSVLLNQFGVTEEELKAVLQKIGG